MPRISYILLLALCLACCLPSAYSEATGTPSQAENKGFLASPAESGKEQSTEVLEVENEEEMRTEQPNNYDDLPSENIEQYFESSRDQIKNEPRRNELNFLVLGDFGLVHKNGPNASTKALGDFLFHKVKRTFVNYDFIVSVGDIMYEYGISDLTDPKIKVLFEDAFKINELGLDWYNTFGNHDCMGSLPITMQLPEKYSLWKQDKPYYSMVKNIGDSNLKVGFLVPNGCDLVCVRKESNECYRGTHKSIQWDDIPNQLQWIEDQLREMSENKEIIWKVVVLHNAVFSAAKKHGDNKDLIQHLLPLFVKYNVDVVLSGHDHNVQYLRMDRTEFLNHKGNDPVGHDFHKHKDQLKKKNQCTTDEYFHYDLTPTGIRRKDDQYNFLQSLLSERDDFMSVNTPKYSREAFADQDKYLHQFVVGNGGKEKEVFCPFEHNKSLANLRYANAVVGVGDVRITEDKFEVTLLSVKNEVLYTARIYRADRE